MNSMIQERWSRGNNNNKKVARERQISVSLLLLGEIIWIYNVEAEENAKDSAHLVLH